MEFFRVKRLAHFFRKLGNIPDFAAVKDHRKKRGRRWEARSLFTSVYLSMLVGKTNFRGAERLTEQLRLKRVFGISRRVPDSTLARFFSELRDEDGLRQVLVQQIRSAERRKALESTRLPINLIAIDGKTIYYGPKPIADVAAQTSHHDFGERYRLHTMHAVLVSADSQPTIDQLLIPGKTNEQGCFAEFFEQLRQTYGRSDRFECISVDAGMTAACNARLVNDAGIGYIMAVKEDQPTLLAEIQRQCGTGRQKQLHIKREWTSSWQSYRGTKMRRELFRSFEIEGWPSWESARQIWRMKQTTMRGDDVCCVNRYFVTNLAPGKLKACEIAEAIRLHWGSENACHWVADVILQEDKYPWCTRGQALRMLSWIRLLALNTLGFIRNRYLRGKPMLPWQSVIDGILQLLLTPSLWKPNAHGGISTACC